MVNNFCTLGCRMVRLGNYEVAPRGKLLTTEAFVQMKVPRITCVGGKKKGSDFVTVEISWKEVLNALAYFGSRPERSIEIISDPYPLKSIFEQPQNH